MYYFKGLLAELRRLMGCYVTCKVLVVYCSFSSDGTYILKIVYELKHLSESFCLAFFLLPILNLLTVFPLIA